MALDPRLILGVQQPDIIGAMAGGNALAAQVNEQQRQNSLSDLYRDQGAGILRGDTNALAALAGLDPAAALGIQTRQQDNTRQQQQFELSQQAQRQQMQATSQRMGILSAQEERAAAEYAASIGAQQAAAEAAQIEDAVRMGLAIQSPEQWDQVMATQAPDLVGQFDNREVFAAKYMSMADVLKRQGGDGFNAENFRVVGNQLYDLAAEGGPRVVGEAAGQQETIFGADGQPILVRGPANAKPLTEGQSKDVVYSTRARGALEAFEPVANSMTSRMDRGLGYLPMGIGREGQNSDFQVAENAGNEFLQAILRKDTGAAITEQEQALYGVTYLPQPGDGPEVLAQKQQARQRAIAAIEGGMSPAQMVAQERALDQSGIAPMAPAPVAAPQGAAMAAEPLREIVAPDIDPAIWDAMTPEEKALFQ